jgi:hypothetical protein
MRQKGNIKRELNEIGYVSMNEMKLAEDCAKKWSFVLMATGQYGVLGFLCFFPVSYQIMLDNMSYGMPSPHTSLSHLKV